VSSREFDSPPWSRVEGTLMSTARAVRRAYDQALAAVGVNLSEASVLAHLGDAGPLTQVELARRIGTGRARIGVYIDALQARGAVLRDADPDDRRVWKVSLTPAGKDLWAQTIDIDRRIRRYLRAGTTAEQREQFDRMLALMQRNVAHIPATEP
jgi:MarR family transcriptional regulator, transcriptional regulator for hemolysin